MSAEPDVLATFAVETDGGVIVFEVIQRGPRDVIARMGRGDGRGIPLSTMQCAALRVALMRCLEVMAPAEGRRAA